MSFGIGVIGAGTHGARYLRHAAHDVAGMHPVALCRRSREPGQTLAAELGCRFHANPQVLVEDPDVQGVIVCTPPSTHFEFAAMVLAQGKALLLEKPFTGTVGQARQLAEMDQNSSGPDLMVGHTLRWNPVIRKIRELWPQLGRVHLVRLAQRLEPTNLSWQRNAAETVGGSVLLTGVHIFDLARHLTGRNFISVDSRQQNILNPVGEDLFLARGELDDGCWVSLEVSKYTQSRCGWLEAVGEEGQIFADYLGDGGVILRKAGKEEIISVSARVPTLPLVLTDWLAAREEGTPASVTAQDGLATMEVVDACYRSQLEQRAIAIPGTKDRS